MTADLGAQWRPTRGQRIAECELAGKLIHAADVMEVAALPGTWPAWMTPEKRRQMAESFRRQAWEIADRHELRSISSDVSFRGPSPTTPPDPATGPDGDER